MVGLLWRPYLRRLAWQVEELQRARQLLAGDEACLRHVERAEDLRRKSS